MPSPTNIKRDLIARCQQFANGSMAEGAAVMRYLIDTLSAAGEVVKQTIPLAELRKTSAMKDALADAAGTNLLGLADAAGSVLSGTQTNNTSVAESASLIYVLPPNYVAGEAITVRARAKVSAARFVSATVDVIAKKITDGALGADICATAAQALTTDYANYDFTITPTGLVAGDSLQLDIYLNNNDTGGNSNGTATISELSVRPTISV